MPADTNTPYGEQHIQGDPGCEPHDHCAIHNVDEPITATTFRVCGECWHAFQTEAELVAAHNARGGSQVTDSSTIYACPECAHDF